MKIKITEFAKRHFDKDFGGTKILDMSVEEFEKQLNRDTTQEEPEWSLSSSIYRMLVTQQSNTNLNDVYIMDGYAPFCKLLAIRNFTDARVGSMPITLENYQYLRSGYSSRRESELPVFSRWLELPLGKPKAEWLVLVLYDKEQLDKEGMSEENYVPFDGDWGVVAILGQSHPNEEPMKPETMLRNALGIEEGGSGVKLDKEKYLESVKFWSENATVK